MKKGIAKDLHLFLSLSVSSPLNFEREEKGKREGWMKRVKGRWKRGRRKREEDRKEYYS